MNRYLKTLRLFWSTALAVQLEYQINFLIELIAMFGTLLGSIFILSLFFRQGYQLGTWSWEAALIIQGIYTFLDGVTNTFLRPNLTEIVNYVREGTLDYVLLKPIDSQFWLSTRTLAPSGLPEMLLGLALIIWASIKAGVLFNINSVIFSLIMLLASIVILYSIWFLVAATSIWFVKTWNATEVLRALLAAGRFPVNAYPLTLRFIFTFILPITFLTTVPAQMILGQNDIILIVLGVSFAFVFYFLSRNFWRFALRHYTSASS
tara:strand:- start:35048 stop:35836 length:789 start_codon:yes stop_codon:yes gene_type:complete